jgi:hypothetical protein
VIHPLLDLVILRILGLLVEIPRAQQRGLLQKTKRSPKAPLRRRRRAKAHIARIAKIMPRDVIPIYVVITKVN